MRKNALTLTLTTLVLGIFGAFLRWLQNMNVFEEETGLAKPWAGLSVALALFTLIALAVMLLSALTLLRRYAAPEAGEAAFHAETPFPAVIAWACAAVFAVCGVTLMFAAGEMELTVRLPSREVNLTPMFGAACIVAGACFPVLPCRRAYENVSILGRRTASVYLSLFYCFWLIFSYSHNAVDPVLWAYAPETLAIVCSTLGFYYAAAAFYGRVRPVRGLLFTQLGAYLDIAVLADGRRMALQAMFAATAAMLLLLEFLAVENLEERSPAPEPDDGE